MIDGEELRRLRDDSWRRDMPLKPGVGALVNIAMFQIRANFPNQVPVMWNHCFAQLAILVAVIPMPISVPLSINGARCIRPRFILGAEYASIS